MSQNKAASVEEYLSDLKQQYPQMQTPQGSSAANATARRRTSNSPFFSPEICYAPGEDTTSPPRIVAHNGTTLFADVIDLHRHGEQTKQQRAIRNKKATEQAIRTAETLAKQGFRPVLPGLTHKIYDVRNNIDRADASEWAKTEWKNVPVDTFLASAVETGSFPLFHVPFGTEKHSETVRVAHQTLSCILPESLEQPLVQNSLLDTFARAASTGADVYLTPDIMRYQFDTIYWRYRMSDPSAQDAECVSKSLRKESAVTVFVESSNSDTNDHPIRHCWSEIVDRVENLMHTTAANGSGAGACDKRVLQLAHKVQSDLHEKGILYKESEMPHVPLDVLDRLFSMCRTTHMPAPLDKWKREPHRKPEEKQVPKKNKRDKLDEWIAVMCRQVHKNDETDETSRVKPPPSRTSSVQTETEMEPDEKKRIDRVRIGGTIDEWLSLIKECYQRTIGCDQNLRHWLSYVMWGLRNIVQHYNDFYVKFGKVPPTTLSPVIDRFIDQQFGVADAEEFWKNLFWHTDKRVGGHAVAMLAPFEANVVLALRESATEECSVSVEKKCTDDLSLDPDQDLEVLIKQCIDTSEHLLKRCEKALAGVNPIRLDVFTRLNVDGVEKTKFAIEQTTTLVHVETATRSVALRLYHGWVGCAVLHGPDTFVFAPVRASTFVVEAVEALDVLLSETANWLIPGVVQNTGTLLNEEDRVIWQASDLVNFKNGYQTSTIDLHRLRIEHGEKKDVYERRHLETLSQQLVEREMFRYGNQNSFLSMHLGIGKSGGVEAWIRARNPEKQSDEGSRKNTEEEPAAGEKKLSVQEKTTKSEKKKSNQAKKTEKKQSVEEVNATKEIKTTKTDKPRQEKKPKRQKPMKTTKQQQQKQNKKEKEKEKKKSKKISKEKDLAQDDPKIIASEKQCAKVDTKQAHVEENVVETIALDSSDPSPVFSFGSNCCWADYESDDDDLSLMTLPWNNPQPSLVLTATREDETLEETDENTLKKSTGERTAGFETGWEKVEPRRGKRRRARKTIVRDQNERPNSSVSKTEGIRSISRTTSRCDVDSICESEKEEIIVPKKKQQQQQQQQREDKSDRLLDAELVEKKSLNETQLGENTNEEGSEKTKEDDGLDEEISIPLIPNDEPLTTRSIGTNDEISKIVEEDFLVFGDFVVPLLGKVTCLMQPSADDDQDNDEKEVESADPTVLPSSTLSETASNIETKEKEVQIADQQQQQENQNVAHNDDLRERPTEMQEGGTISVKDVREDLQQLTASLSVCCIDDIKVCCDWRKSVDDSAVDLSLSAAAKCARPFTIDHTCSGHAEDRSLACDSLVRFYCRQGTPSETNVVTRSLYGLLLLVCDAILPCTLCGEEKEDRLMTSVGVAAKNAVVLQGCRVDYVDQFVQTICRTVLPACLCCGRVSRESLQCALFVFGVATNSAISARAAWACDERCMNVIEESATSGCLLGVDVTFELLGLENNNRDPIVRASLSQKSKIYCVAAIYETPMLKCRLTGNATRGSQTRMVDLTLAYGLPDSLRFYSDMWSMLRFYRRIDKQISAAAAAGSIEEDNKFLPEQGKHSDSVGESVASVASGSSSSGSSSCSSPVSKTFGDLPLDGTNPYGAGLTMNAGTIPTVAMSIPYNLVPLIWNLLQAQENIRLYAQVPLYNGVAATAAHKPVISNVHQFYGQQNQQHYMQQQTQHTLYAPASQ